MQSHHADLYAESSCRVSASAESHTSLSLVTHAPLNFMCTSSRGLFSLLVTAMLSLADAKCLSHADDPQECKWAVAMAMAVDCKWADLQAILES